MTDEHFFEANRCNFGQFKYGFIDFLTNNSNILKFIISFVV